MSMTEDMLRRMRADDARLRQTETKEIPPLYLPWTQRVLNPFPLASSGNVWGDTGQPWSVQLLAWYVSVFVAVPNNGTNFWTLTLVNPAGTTLASLSTSALTAGVYSRMSTVAITQPAASNAALAIVATATLSPGAIIIDPALALLRIGN